MIYLRWEEALKVEAAATSLRNRLIIRLPLYAGFRAHEIVDLRIEHIDPVDRTIYIPHGHRNGARYVAIDRETLRLLAIYVGARKTGVVFLSRKKKTTMTRWCAYFITRTTAQRAGIRKAKSVCPLVLRHTFATTWLRRRGNIRLLQKQLGHTKLESTARYLDWLPEEITEEYEFLFEKKDAARAPEKEAQLHLQLQSPRPAAF